jgi:PAS domain S-box-containing protein
MNAQLGISSKVFAMDEMSEPLDLSRKRILGSGKMASLIRDLNWTPTSLGPIDRWSHEFISVVNLMLSSPMASALYCGGDLIFLYNDAYLPLIGSKHPQCLGQPARVVWQETWDLVGVDLSAALESGVTKYLENVRVPIVLDGRLQDRFWTYTISPVYERGRITAVYSVSLDTTATVEAGAARDRAAQQIRQMLDAASDGVIGVDRDWKITFVNRSAEGLTAAVGPLTGRNFWEAFPATEFEGSPYVEHYHRAMHERIAGQFEAYYPAPFDAWFAIAVRPYEDGVVIFFRNVTQERHAQEALRQNEGRLNAVYNTALEYVGILSPDGIVLDCNRASLEFAGNTRADVVGRYFWDAPWFTYTPGASEACRQAVAHAAGGGTVRTELALNRPSGEKLIFDFSLTPVCDAAGQVVYLIPEGRDITSLKEAEESARRSAEALALSQEELRWTIDLSSQIPFTADVNGRVINFSDNWLDMTGLTREDLLGEGWVRVQHPDDVRLIAERRDHAVRTGEPFDVEHRVRTVSGEYRWMRSRAYPRRDETGRIVKWYGTLEDIEERKRAEAALLQSEKLAAVGRLAASIAHEINNPLEAVTNLLYLAQVSENMPEMRKFLGQAEQELRRVAAITNQTLRFHKQSTSPRAVTCDELIDSVLAINHGRIANSHIEVRRGGRVSSPVTCFDGEIRQVLANLVGNAIDAMNPKGGILLLRSREATNWKTARKGTSLTVADTGIGITQSDIKRIFEPFFTTKGISGTGLGLWISKEIVARHKGALSVRSCQSDGQTGSVFRLFLPYEQADNGCRT